MSNVSTQVLHVLEKSYYNFTLNFFFMKELKGAILYQNHRRCQWGGPECPGPLNRNATNDTSLTKKACFFIFISFLHLCVQQYKRTLVINNK